MTFILASPAFLAHFKCGEALRFTTGSRAELTVTKNSKSTLKANKYSSCHVCLCCKEMEVPTHSERKETLHMPLRLPGRCLHRRARKVLFLFLFLVCTCSSVLLLRVFASYYYYYYTTTILLLLLLLLLLPLLLLLLRRRHYYSSSSSCHHHYYSCCYYYCCCLRLRPGTRLRPRLRLRLLGRLLGSSTPLLLPPFFPKYYTGSAGS